MSRRHPLIFWSVFAAAIVLLVIAPLVLPEFWRRFVTEVLIWGLLAMSSDLLIGYTGMISFGHSAFFGLGMYGAAAALLTTHPASLWVALLYGLIAAAGVAAFVAYFSTRLRDIYFAITTLIFSQIFYVIIFTSTAWTGGENGLTFDQPALAIPGLFSLEFTPEVLHWFVLAVVAGSYLLLRRITQSPFGMVLQSIRENEARTRAIGYPVQRYKIVSVMLSGLFAGLAGVLYAIQNQFAAPDFVFFVISGQAVIYNVIGGVGTLVGPIVGAAFFLLLSEAFRGCSPRPTSIHRAARPRRHELPGPAGPDLHRHGDLHAAGPAWLRQALAQSLVTGASTNSATSAIQQIQTFPRFGLFRASLRVANRRVVAAGGVLVARRLLEKCRARWARHVR